MRRLRRNRLLRRQAAPRAVEGADPPVSPLRPLRADAKAAAAEQAAAGRALRERGHAAGGVEAAGVRPSFERAEMPVGAPRPPRSAGPKAGAPPPSARCLRRGAAGPCRFAGPWRMARTGPCSGGPPPPARSRRCGATRRRRFAGSAASALPHGWTWPQRPLPEIGWLRAIVREMSVQDAALDQKRSQRRQFRLRDLIGVAHRPECAWEGKDG